MGKGVVGPGVSTSQTSFTVPQTEIRIQPDGNWRTMRLSLGNESRDHFLKTSLVALLLALTITGCDQVIERLSSKTSNNPSVAQPETAKESSPKDVPRGTEIPAKKDEREGDKKPAVHTRNREHLPSPKTNQTQRDEQKKREGINQQQEPATVDSKGKSAIQAKRKADVKPPEVDDTYTGTVRRGNVSREY